MSRHLTPDQESIVESAMAKGLASSAEEFVSDALRAQLERASFERFVRDEVVPGNEEHLKDPSQGKTIDEVRAELLEK